MISSKWPDHEAVSAPLPCSVLKMAQTPPAFLSNQNYSMDNTKKRLQVWSNLELSSIQIYIILSCYKYQYKLQKISPCFFQNGPVWSEIRIRLFREPRSYILQHCLSPNLFFCRNCSVPWTLLGVESRCLIAEQPRLDFAWALFPAHFENNQLICVFYGWNCEAE